MKLYYSETIAPRKACAVARFLNSPVEFVRVDLGKGEHRTPAFRAINPNAKVPALTDGGKSLWEANAIMAHLAIKAGSDLWPRDGRQVDVVRWLTWDSEHFTRHTGEFYFQYVIKPMFGIGEPDPSALKEPGDNVRKYAAILDAHLAASRYLVGDTLTIADFAVSVTLPYAEKSHLPLDGFAHIARWKGDLAKLDAWRDPFPAPIAAAA